MALELEPRCERCEAALAADDECYICVFECTFCPDCTDAMEYSCLNCGNELVRRPRQRPPRRAP